MCLTPISKEKTAKKDILVYKVIDDLDKSFHYNFQYTPNETYNLDKKLAVVETCHSIDNYELISEKIINEGFHSFDSLEPAGDWYWVSLKRGISKLVEFTIPKGAKYYIGTNGELVSSSIRAGNLDNLWNTWKDKGNYD